MTRKIFGAFALALVLLVGLVAARMVYAQTSGGMDGMMGMMSMMKDCPMMGASDRGPAAVLEHREALGLTDAQAARLESLQERTKQDPMQATERMKRAHAEIRQATAGDEFNETAARAAFDRMGRLHTEMGVAMLRTRHEVRQVLTAEQRAKLEQMDGSGMRMGGMMGMMGGMDMESCPMMKGGKMGGGMMKHGEGGSMRHHQK